MRSEFISKYFPLPKFLIPSHIGISFSDTNIKAISISGTKLKPDLKSMVVPLDQGAIVGGKIMNAEKVAEKLSIIKEYFDSPFVFFTIPDELVYVFQVAVPVLKSGDIAEGIAFTIEENVPLALADVNFDFKPVNVTKLETGYQSDVVVVACVKKEVEKFSEVITSSGMSGVGCIHESQAVADAVIPHKSSGTYGIIHSRKDRVGIYLVKDGLVRFSTIRSVGEGDYADQFLDEYSKFLEYSVRDKDIEDGAIKTMFVCGDFEYSKKIIEIIFRADNLTKNAKLANVWSNVLQLDNTTPSISYEDSLSLAGPLGAVLSQIL